MQQGENFLKSADFRITKIKIRVKSKAPVKAGKGIGGESPPHGNGYRFNPKPAPTLISGSGRMDRIKHMATSRGSFSMPRRISFRRSIV